MWLPTQLQGEPIYFSNWKLREVYEEVWKHYKFEFEDLKNEQEMTLLHILNGTDCLAVLPTGFGKSATYYLLPLLRDIVNNVLH